MAPAYFGRHEQGGIRRKGTMVLNSAVISAGLRGTELLPVSLKAIWQLFRPLLDTCETCACLKFTSDRRCKLSSYI